MSYAQIKGELVDAGLHEESVERMLDHYEKMRLALGSHKYGEAGRHIGTFCENTVNLLREEMGEGVKPSVKVGKFVDDSLNGKIGLGAPDEVRLSIPRAISAAYEIRNNRDSVHVNLDVPVNHADTQTGVRICSWILGELLRVYGDEDHMDEIAQLIDELASPVTPFIDIHNGKRLIMNTDLTPPEEILIHLFVDGKELDSEELADWIPGASKQTIGGSLGQMKRDRLVYYEDGRAKITARGAKRAEEIIEENFDKPIHPDASS
ncbi:hypothetical protein ACFQH6_03535 [Halobacteriaceae archaeon GCM10025711]